MLNKRTISQMTGEEDSPNGLVAGVPERHECARALVDRDRLDRSLGELPRIPDVDLTLARAGESRGDDAVERAHPGDARALDARVRVRDRHGSCARPGVKQSKLFVFARTE